MQSKSQKRIFIAAATALFFGLPSCSAINPDATSEDAEVSKGYSAGTPIGTAATSLSVVGQRPAALALAGADIPLIDIDGTIIGSLNMTDAYLALDKIKLLQSDTAAATLALQEIETESEDVEAEEDDSADNESGQDPFEFKGPFICNLIDNTMSPSPESLLIPDGSYTGIKMEMKRLEADNADAAGLSVDHVMRDRSLYVAGQITWAADSSVTAFNMEYRIDEEFKVFGTGAVGVAEGVSNAIVIAFKLASWLDLSNAEINEEGSSFAPFVGATTLALSENSTVETEKALWKAIKEGIKNSTKFGKDDDGNGKLEEDEDNDAENDDESEAEDSEESVIQ